MNSEDMQKAYLLLEVVEKCAGHPGRFPAIVTAATAALDELNGQLRDAQMAATKEAADAKANAEADAAAKAPKAIPSNEANAGGAEVTAADGARRL